MKVTTVIIPWKGLYVAYVLAESRYGSRIALDCGVEPSRWQARSWARRAIHAKGWLEHRSSPRDAYMRGEVAIAPYLV